MQYALKSESFVQENYARLRKHSFLVSIYWQIVHMHLSHIFLQISNSINILKIPLGYIPVISSSVLVDTPTFEIWSDSCIITGHFSHKLVQEFWRGHGGGSFPSRCLLGRCQAVWEKKNGRKTCALKNRVGQALHYVICYILYIHYRSKVLDR